MHGNENAQACGGGERGCQDMELLQDTDLSAVFPAVEALSSGQQLPA